MMDASGALRVMIVDDSTDDAILLAENLKENGLTVVWQCIETSWQLQEEMRENDWDLILCDNDLPELDARRALEIVRRYRQEIPFIIVSGGISEEDAAELMKLGASDYISKHNLSRLLPVIGRELRDSAMHRDLAWANQRIGSLVRLDAASGLPNFQSLRDHLDAILKKGGKVALILVEFCRYGELLDGFGHAGESQLLRAFSGRLSGFNHGGFLGRFGEHVFALVLPLENGLNMEDCGREIVESFRKPLRIGEEELFVNCRVGCSVAPEGEREADLLLSQAEAALQCAGNPESGGFGIYMHGMEERKRKKLELERAIYQAVHNDEFTLAYQPQFDLATRRMVGAEALMRWKRGGDWVSPAEFIPLLEETGLIIPVGERILRRACEANRNWQLQGLPEIRMAVNLSAIQFRQPDLAGKVRHILDETGLDSRHLALEITENIAMYNGPEVISMLNELKMLGVELALDDFGTGYSSLAYLKHFPVGKLKIDQSFVRDIVADKSNEAIVKAILAIADSLGLTVIAEGVENLEQATLLEACGCAEVQGYFFCPPVSEKELEGMLVKAREQQLSGQIQNLP